MNNHNHIENENNNNDNTPPNGGTPATATSKPSILRELCTQTDWSQRIHYPGYRAILLLFIVTLNKTWINYKFLCEKVPLFYTDERMLTTAQWKESKLACLDALCDISDTIHFDCKVHETGDSAHMLALDESTPQELPFESEIPIPSECVELATLMIGSENIQSEMFETDTINLFYYDQNQLQPQQHDDKKKAIFQLLPGQCSIWTIFQQNWYQWADHAEGNPPPPFPAIDYKSVAPGQVVHIKASHLLCYKSHVYQQHKDFWRNSYEVFMEFRWHIACCIAFAVCCAVVGMISFGTMIHVVPLTFCLVRMIADDERGGNRFWRVWKVLFGLCILNFAIRESDQTYFVCILAGGSMLFYNNSKAAMELSFLHILVYAPEWEYIPVEIHWLPGSILKIMGALFLPGPGLLWKCVTAYMIYMVFPRLSQP